MTCEVRVTEFDVEVIALRYQHLSYTIEVMWQHLSVNDLGR